MDSNGKFWAYVWISTGIMISMIILSIVVYNIYDGKRDADMAKLGYNKTQVMRCINTQVFTEWTK